MALRRLRASSRLRRSSTMLQPNAFRLATFRKSGAPALMDPTDVRRSRPSAEVTESIRCLGKTARSTAKPKAPAMRAALRSTRAVCAPKPSKAAQKVRRKSLTSPAPGAWFVASRPPELQWGAWESAALAALCWKDSDMADPLRGAFAILEHPVQNPLVHAQTVLGLAHQLGCRAGKHLLVHGNGLHRRSAK